MLQCRKTPLFVVALTTLAATSAHAGATVGSVSVFASGSAVGGTQPDSVTIGDHTVWIEYGNGADSMGLSGLSTIVQYGLNGKVLNTYSISGLVDGLKWNPVSGTVWALQNNDDNSALSIINPTTNVVTPYAYDLSYTPGLGRGFDDVAFLGDQAFLSYSNPASPTDPVVEKILQGANPSSGPLTIAPIAIDAQTINPNFTNSNQAPPDTDSLKTTWFGDLVLTSEGDSPGNGAPPPASTAAVYSLIANPGSAHPTVTNVFVTDAGVGVYGMDDVVFPDASKGWLYVSSTGSDQVYRLWLTGLNRYDPIVAIGGLDEVAIVDGATGAVQQAVLTAADGLSSPHGMEFVAAPEASTWAMILMGFAGLGYAGLLARAARPAA